MASHGVTLKMTSKGARDKQIKNLKRRLENLRGKEGHVGFFQEKFYPFSSEEGDRMGMNVAAIAYSNNHGIEVAGNVPIPRRPFFTLAVNAMFRSFESDILPAVRSVLAGDRKFDRLLKAYLEKWTMEIRHQIDIVQPPNTPYTLSLKSGSKPLIQTGLMYDSIDTRIVRE